MNASSKGGLIYMELPDINIPSGENEFTIRAIKNARWLEVAVGYPTYWYKDGVGYQGIIELSRSNVPPGKYYIKIWGNALYDATEVPLRLTAITKIKSDEKGNFSSIYSTSGFPAGNYFFYVRSETRTITLRERPAPSISSSGTSPTTVQPIPEVTPTPLPTPIAAIITNVAETTPVPDITRVITSAPSATLPDPKPTPGFEIALFSAIAILNIIKRRL